MPSQQFDTLDGLVVTGKMDVGANLVVNSTGLVVDTVNNRVGINKVPTVAFDVSGDVNIDGGTIDGLTQLSVDNLTLDGRLISSSANLDLEATGSMIANTSNGILRLDKNGTPYGEFTSAAGSMVIGSGASSVPAITLDASGNAILAQNLSMSNGKYINFGSVMDITASAQGATFSANTYHSGQIVANGDTNTYLKFTGSDAIEFYTGNSKRLTINNSGLTVSGTLTSTGQAIVTDSVTVEKVFAETVVTPAGMTFDLNDGSAFTKSLSGAGGTVAFTMPSPTLTGTAISWTIKFNNSGSLTWPASVKWSEGVEPPESTGIDIYSFVTYDNGTNIYASLALRDAG